MQYFNIIHMSQYCALVALDVPIGHVPVIWVELEAPFFRVPDSSFQDMMVPLSVLYSTLVSLTYSVSLLNLVPVADW